MMNAVHIEFPSICMRALLDQGHGACGVEGHERHFAGNYWWTTCDHVARLPPLTNRFDV